MDQFDGCEAKLADNVKWWEKIVLFFQPFRTHLSGDGFVLYKQFRHVLYIYAHGHFVIDDSGERRRSPIDPGFDGQSNEPWRN